MLCCPSFAYEAKKVCLVIEPVVTVILNQIEVYNVRESML